MTARLPSPVLGIRACGAVTNLGNTAPQTLASWVAQTRRQHRVKLEGFADPFTLADRPDLTEGLEGVERLFALLESAVAEALENEAPPDNASSLNLLVLPRWLDDEAQQQLTERLAGFWPDHDILFAPITGNATAAWVALDSAYQVLDANPKIQQVVIACVDSLCEPTQLYEAAEAEQLLKKENSEGYVPGEAAVCLVLERLRDVKELPADHYALHRPVLAQQADPWWPADTQPNPEPLITVLSGALEQAGMKATHISHQISDMDGSSWRAQISSLALGGAYFSEVAGRPHWRPATLFGQIGTATGALGWIISTMMHANHIKRVNTVLNWSLDQQGKSAACVLERSPKIV